MIRRILEKFGFLTGMLIVTAATCVMAVALTMGGHTLWGNPIKPVYFFNAIVVPIIIVPIVVGSLFRALKQLQSTEQQLYVLATTDTLTQLLNRRHFYEITEMMLAQVRRGEAPLSILLIDADNFKAVNDRYGHLKGDEVLKDIACLCRGAIRESDVIARFGGEEFICALPHTDVEGAAIVAERIVQQLRHSKLDVSTTVSVGIATIEPQQISEGMDEAIARADSALYIAKSAGRDRWVRWCPEIEMASSESEGAQTPEGRNSSEFQDLPTVQPSASGPLPAAV